MESYYSVFNVPLMYNGNQSVFRNFAFSKMFTKIDRLMTPFSFSFSSGLFLEESTTMVEQGELLVAVSGDDELVSMLDVSLLVMIVSNCIAYHIRRQ